MRSFALIFLLLISATSCHRAPVLTQDDSESDPMASSGERHSLTDASFAPATIQVLDDVSSLPIPGVGVRALCLGGTLYQDSQDVTNKDGFATVNYWSGKLVGVHIEKDGYLTDNTFIKRENAVYRLKRIP